MSKLSFRARALDVSKPMPICLAEELPDLPDYSAINRAVPQMPSGMEKEEECEHHLQRAICTGLIIPTPEVFPLPDIDAYEKFYSPDYKMPKQHIHMQPLWQEQETPEYDMDSEDERWLRQQRHPELTALKFEQMMDRLEKSSGQTVATLSEAKLLLERQDDLVIAVYDYWLNKRLKTQHPLILSVRTENRAGQSTNNPYLAFRRRTEKMQTRKNRKNDESSYEKMLKLRRDLARAATLLDMVARRERAKRDLLRLTALIAERRFAAADFAGHLIAEIAHSQPAYTALSLGAGGGAGAAAGYRRDAYAAPHYLPRAPAQPPGVDQPRQREKRTHKRRRRPHGAAVAHQLRDGYKYTDSGVCTSSDEEYAAAGGAGAARAAAAAPPPPAPPDDGPFAFTRKPGCYYELPTSTLYGDPVDPDRVAKDALYRHDLDHRHRFTLTSLTAPYERCIGFGRRRVGRGGRVLLDRVRTPLDDLWPRLPFTFTKSSRHRACKDEEMNLEMRAHRHPKELVRDYHTSGKYPWRHAFRRHLANNSRLWVCDDAYDELPPEADLKKVKVESMDVDDEVDAARAGRRPADPASDDSAGDCRVQLDRRATRALREHVRKRSWSACSDSSYDSEASLLPVEDNFRQFFEEVNNKWSHFRPRTPVAGRAAAAPDEGGVAVGGDSPLAMEVYAWGERTPRAAAELTLRELRPPEPDPAGGDGAPDDLLAENFTGLTDAQLESILAETVADDARRGDDILEELVRDVALDPKDHFLSRGQSAAPGRAASGLAPPAPGPPALADPAPARFGSSLVAVTADDGPLLLAAPDPPAPAPATSTAAVAPVAPAPTPVPAPSATRSPKVAASPGASFAPKASPAPKLAPALTSTPSPVPAAKIIVEEVDEAPAVRGDGRRARVAARDDALRDDASAAHGVHLKTVHNKHSPLKKHIITSAPHRAAGVGAAVGQPQPAGAGEAPHGPAAPQIVTVAVSESLKVRLQNHLLSAQQAAAVGLVPNGPISVSAAHGVAVSGAAVAVSAAGAGARRVAGGAPVVHLSAGALQQKALQLAPPVVVGAPHALHHVPPNKVKVLQANTLTHSQRAQLLAHGRAPAGLAHLSTVVSLGALADGKAGQAAAARAAPAPAPALQLKATPTSVAQFFEIKGAPLAKGPQLVNVVRQPHPAKAAVARFDLDDPKKRGAHVLAAFDGSLKGGPAAAGAAGAARPHRVSLASLDGRHLVRAAIPGVRAPHLRHQIQLKNRTLQIARPEPAAASAGGPAPITIAPASKSSALPGAVVANLLHKNVAQLHKGHKIAISSAVGMQPLAANVQAIAFSAHQLKARQARLVAQPRATVHPEIAEASSSAAGGALGALGAGGGGAADGALDGGEPAEATTNGAVRRRPGPADSLPMEVT